MINNMPAKSSPLDFLPTSVLKSCADIFGGILARLANLSFCEVKFPSKFKVAQITPILKKEGLNANDPSNFRPISNLNTIAKTLEKLFSTRLTPHVHKSPGFNPLQSAYRTFHSTETSLNKILDDVYRNIDGKKITVLIALDLSAAFDTLDHATLLQRLNTVFGITGSALEWLRTYLFGRKQFVGAEDFRSPSCNCMVGVPQGSVLGPSLFSLFIVPLSNIISSFGLSFHQYADDTKLYIGIPEGEFGSSSDILSKCTSALQE